MTSITRRFAHTAAHLNIPSLVDWTQPRLKPALSNDVRLLISGWSRNDPRPLLEPIEDFQVMRSTDTSLIGALAGITPYEAATRMQDGHLLYIGWLDQQPVAYGWSAVQRAEIGEIGCSFIVPDNDRYCRILRHFRHGVVVACTRACSRPFLPLKALLPSASGSLISRTIARPSEGSSKLDFALLVPSSVRTVDYAFMAVPIQCEASLVLRSWACGAAGSSLKHYAFDMTGLTQ